MTLTLTFTCDTNVTSHRQFFWN